MTRLFAVLVLLAGLLTATLPTPSVAQSTTVSEIIISGTQRIDPATVETYADVKVGDSVDPSALNDALRRLYATNLFDDVTISLDGSAVVITVDENPIINQISIEGNDVLEDENLLTVINIQPRRVFTEQLAINGKERLVEVYRQAGRYAAVIEPKIIELPDNRVDLVFEVDEGPLIKISSIKFIGNEAFSDRALKNVIESRESKWYIFLASNDKYDANRLNIDTQRLRQFYLQNGYADVSIPRSSGELLPDRSGFVLTFQIEENQPYTVGEITVTSEIEDVDIDSLYETVTLVAGEPYDVRVVEESLSGMTNKLGDNGYAFVNVTPDLQTDKETGVVDIVLSVGAAQRNYVETINIRGNDRTLDRVIRRQFELVEGDSFNQLRLRRSERNVRNLGYFSRVSVDVLPGSAVDQSVIDMLVEETTTGSLQLGVGYSTFDKVSFTLGINENNFLGTGRGARANVSFSDTTTNFRAGITEPFLLDRNLQGSFDVFRQEQDYTGVDLERTGVDLGIGFSAANDFRHRIGYLIADSQTTTTSSTGSLISGDEGSELISEVSYSLIRDTRDSRLNPTRGYLWRLTESLAGLGGDTTYAKTVLRGQYVKPFYFNSVIIGVDGEVGHIDGLGEDVTRSNRFVLGGRKLRGFASTGVGPRDAADNSSVGGNQYYSGSVNLVSDIGFDKDLGMRWTVFSDFGSVWGVDNAMCNRAAPMACMDAADVQNNPASPGIHGLNDSSVRASLGWGLLWDTAIGPMTFMWAYPLAEEDYDRTKIFQFRFGSVF